MALTKVTGQVINTSTDVTVGVLTVTNTLAVGGTVSIGGTLTYEDVTNIDSVGLITARNGIVVGSGITLSKDGDVFFTGIATGNGSGLTNLPAANLTGTLPAISGANLTNLDASDLTSGTVPTARLGSGTASSSTFLRGDSTFQTVNTDLVSDTSPQLGGDLASNGHDIKIADASGYDGNNIYMGSDNDVRIHHDGSNFSITEATGDVTIQSADDIFLKPQAGENGIKVIGNGAIELYYDSSKKFETNSTGSTLFCTGNGNNEGPKVEGSSGMPAILNFQSDAGAANNDKCRFYAHQSGGQLLLQDFSQGSFQNMANFKHNAAVELYHAGTKMCETSTIGLAFPAGKGIDFSATSGSGTSELLDDYEEGTFTPTYDGTWINISNSELRQAKYTKIGNVVHVWMEYFMSSNNGEYRDNSNIRGLPFTGTNNPSDLYVPVNLSIMYGPSGFSMDSNAAGRAYLSTYDDRLYFKMGTYNGIRHIWIQITYPTTYFSA